MMGANVLSILLLMHIAYVYIFHFGNTEACLVFMQENLIFK